MLCLSGFELYSPGTNIRTFSVFYQGPVFFNKLSAYIRVAPSLNSFQSRVKTFSILLLNL